MHRGKALTRESVQDVMHDQVGGQGAALSWLAGRAVCHNSRAMRRSWSASDRHEKVPALPLSNAQCFMLAEKHRGLLRRRYGVHTWTFEQYDWEAVWIPGGCPHQVTAAAGARGHTARGAELEGQQGPACGPRRGQLGAGSAGATRSAASGPCVGPQPCCLALLPPLSSPAPRCATCGRALRWPWTL